MMDNELAELYGVETKRLNEQVKRNIERFPDDFMFQLTDEEWKDLKSQNATSRWGGRRKPPYMFTEQGVAMLSSILNSQTAIDVNISIMRVFVKMRKWASDYSDLAEKIEQLQNVQGEHNEHIAKIYNIIKELIEPIYKNREKIGFKRNKND
ncbi:MAG: ORF6N domain-containing protein [Bacteroidota bacterium]